MSEKTCQAPCDPPCPRPVHAHGLCRAHYKRQTRGDSIDAPIGAHGGAHWGLTAESVLPWLEAQPGAVMPSEMAAALGISRTEAQTALRSLFLRGLIQKIRTGLYWRKDHDID